MNALKLLTPLAIGIILGGCAHPIVISPDINKITPVPSSTLIKKNVAYYVDPTLTAKIVKVVAVAVTPCATLLIKIPKLVIIKC